MDNQLNNDSEKITPSVISDQENEGGKFNKEGREEPVGNEPLSKDDLPDDEAANEDNSLENEPLDEET